ncbi:MAG: hypothetical protein N3B15_01665, partial [Planctomycetota bacterium]|nr:hypothetical protein [Planctomycetota bacterium]
RVPVIVAGGAPRDPLLSAPADAVRALRRAAPSAAEAQARQEEIIIDDCLARQDWEGLVHAASSAAAGPRLRYAAVVALLRLGDADGARAAAAALQERFPGHPLALAAQEVLAAAQPPANGAP